MRKHYSAQFKAEAVLELLREKKALAEVAAERQVHPSMLIRWRRLLVSGLPQVFAHEGAAGRARSEYQKKIHELYAEIGRLTTDLEWLNKKAFVLSLPPTTPPDVQTAVRLIARLGGFLGRASDGDPGVKVLWRGFRRLADIVEDWRVFRPGGWSDHLLPAHHHLHT